MLLYMAPVQTMIGLDSTALPRFASTVSADYGVPEAEIAKVRGQLRHYDVLRFAQKYSISLDWLICGEVKGLIRTLVARRT